MRIVGLVALASTVGACAPVTWRESTAVVAREVHESAPRHEAARDTVDASLALAGDTVVATVSRTQVCSYDQSERVTVERTERAEPDETMIILDHVALFTGAAAAVVGAGLAVACIGERGSQPCDAGTPLVIGGLSLEVGGAVALAVDSSKRRTRGSRHDEEHAWEPALRECARAPVPGATVALVRDDGVELRGTTDARGVASVDLHANRRPFDVEVRVDGRPLRRQRIQ